MSRYSFLKLSPSDMEIIESERTFLKFLQDRAFEWVIVCPTTGIISAIFILYEEAFAFSEICGYQTEDIVHIRDFSRFSRIGTKNESEN